MALAVPCTLNDWDDPWRDLRRQRTDSRRLSEESEEGQKQSDGDESSEAWEEDVEQDSDSSDDDEEEEETEEETETDSSSSIDKRRYDHAIIDDDDKDDDSIDSGDFSDRSLSDDTSQCETSVDEKGVDLIVEYGEDEDFAKYVGNSRLEEDNEEDSETDDDEESDSDEEEEEEEEVTEDYDNYDGLEYAKVKMDYYHQTYPEELFHTLCCFRRSLLLTDLTLGTWHGCNHQAHFLVIAAISTLVQQKLYRQREWSRAGLYLLLGPDVASEGLAPILDFAYTGSLPDLDEKLTRQVQVAARALAVPRVLVIIQQRQEREQRARVKAEEAEKKRVKEQEEKKERKEGNEEEEKDENEENKEDENKEEEKEEEEEDKGLSPLEEQAITLQAIKALWTENAGCDVVLRTDSKMFHVHRVILAASSDYFRAMFTNGMRESHEWSVTLYSVGDDQLEAFLNCCYSGSLALSWGWVFDVVCAAIQFQLQPPLKLCLDFLHNEMDANFCLDVASFARAYKMEELLQFAENFVLKNFQDVSASPKFQDLPLEKVLEFLQSKELSVPSEIVILRAVLSWIGARPKSRVKLASDLVNTIKFPLLTFKEFNEAEVFAKWPHRSMRRLYKSMLSEFCSEHVDENDEFRDYLPKDNLILIGGDGVTSDMDRRKISREVWFSNALRNHTGIIKAVDWRLLGELPDIPKYCHEVVVLEDKLYVCGGRHFYGTEDVLKTVFRYDPNDNSWTKVADMQLERCHFAMLVTDGMIYAIGGEKESDLNMDSVERYCPQTNTWSFVCPLDQPMCSHAGSVWGGQMYISGGFNCEYQSLVSMFLYHPERGTTYLADMPTNRALHRMECVGDHLYVAGGLSSNDNGQCFDQLSCEVYSLESDFWYTISPMPKPHVGAASAVLEDKLYILGGYYQDDYADSTLVHRYDPIKGRWENMGKMPGASTEIRACLIRLPANLRE